MKKYLRWSVPFNNNKKRSPHVSVTACQVLTLCYDKLHRKCLKAPEEKIHEIKVLFFISGRLVSKGNSFRVTFGGEIRGTVSIKLCLRSLEERGSQKPHVSHLSPYSREILGAPAWTHKSLGVTRIFLRSACRVVQADCTKQFLF